MGTGLKAHASHCESKGATVVAKQKLLEKQKDELKRQLQEAKTMARHQFGSPIRIQGEASGTLDAPIACFQEVSFAYGLPPGTLRKELPRRPTRRGASQPRFLLNEINLAIYPRDRIALVGR